MKHRLTVYLVVDSYPNPVVIDCDSWKVEPDTKVLYVRFGKEPASSEEPHSYAFPLASVLCWESQLQ
jgi:hypothetical protein